MAPTVSIKRTRLVISGKKNTQEGVQPGGAVDQRADVFQLVITRL